MLSKLVGEWKSILRLDRPRVGVGIAPAQRRARAEEGDHPALGQALLDDPVRRCFRCHDRAPPAGVQSVPTPRNVAGHPRSSNRELGITSDPGRHDRWPFGRPPPIVAAKLPPSCWLER
jgi:hypothetical protein